MLQEMPALVDAQLLRLFPGRTLEELDQIDYLRLQRALHARRIVDVENKRLGNFPADKYTAAELILLRDNERLIRDGETFGS